MMDLKVRRINSNNIKLKNLGFSKIITTPHTMSDYYKNTPEIIKKGTDQVLKKLKKEIYKLNLILF